jgi:TRAP-type C4-dicarboxylate transport system substrate-binding protein
MKRYLFILTIALVVVALLVGGCSSKSTAPAPEEKSAESSPSAPTPPSAESYSWKLASPLSSTIRGNKPVQLFAKKLEERTNGAVKITLYEGTLSAARNEFWDMAKSNTVQIVYTAEPHNPGRLPVTSLINLPFEIPDLKAASLVLDAWLEAGYLKELTDNFKVLYFRIVPHNYLYLRDKKVTATEDLKGMKIRVPQAMQNKVLTALGATPVNLPGEEVYMSLERKVIDGYLDPLDVTITRHLDDIIKYAPKFPFNVGVFMLLMNKETWESLPPDLQETIDQLAEEVVTVEHQELEAEEEGYWEALSKKAEVYTLSKEEEAKWRNVAAPIINEYVEEIAAKGYPAKEALELMRKVVSDYQK